MADCVDIVDVPATEVWSRLAADTSSVLIDVRTRAEWMFVGLPDISALNRRAWTIEWQSFPDGRVDPGFAEKLSTLLDETGVAKNAELFFLCRSGARSRSAAAAVAGVGYTRCRNVADGFEGPLDAAHRRGRVAGWKAAGLPWRQG